jgi:hypothetical protein
MVGFPLLLIPLAIYNIVVFLMPSVSLTETLVSVPLMTSGAEWQVALSDILLALAILMLLLEVIKGARPGAKFVTDHLLSLIVFGVAAAEFLLWPRFANSTYFLLTLLALVDFLTSVALRVRRTPAVAGASRGARPAPVEARPEPAEAESHVERHAESGAWPPANQATAAAPTEPRFTQPEPAAAAPAPEPRVESKPASGESHPPETH